MLKRVNFTGRRRISRDRVQIEVYDGNPRTFSAGIDLEGTEMLPDAAVFLEAMCAGSPVVERFDYGKVGGLKCDQMPKLSDVEGENVFFALKVIDRTEQFGRILGIAETIRPERAGKQTAAGRRGILPIEPQDLGQEIWRLEFQDRDVFLLVNNKVPGLVDRARSDPLFYSVVYPAVVRRVLTEAFRTGATIDEDDDRWPQMWLRFGKNLHPTRENPPDESYEEAQHEEHDDWIEQVVGAFCNSHEMMSRFAAGLANGNGGEA